MSLIASTSKQVGNFGDLTTDAINSTGGKLAVAWVGGYSESPASVIALSDNKSNTWTKLTQRSPGLSGDPYHGAMFYCINPTVGTGHTFTGTGLVNGTLIVGIFDDVVAAFDDENGATGGNGTTSISTGSVTPASAEQLFIAAVTNDSGSPVSIDSSFTEIADAPATSGVGGALAYKMQTGEAAAENPTWTVPAQGGRGVVAAMASFRLSGASYEYKVDALSAADNDPIGTLPETYGGPSLEQATTAAKPLYKTNITGGGKPVLRGDGVDDWMQSVSSISGAKHIFIVGAFRGASNSAYKVLLETSGNDQFLMNASMDFAAVGTHYRDGVNTLAIYPSGQFAIYEAVNTSGSWSGLLNLLRNSGGNWADWDIAYIGIYNREVTGSELTSVRNALNLNYLILPPTVSEINGIAAASIGQVNNVSLANVGQFNNVDV